MLDEIVVCRFCVRLPFCAAPLVSLLFLSFLLLCSARAQKLETPQPSAELPAGAMQAKATKACLECHEARIILQQRLDKAGWAKEVDKMRKWGAFFDAADREALINYLSENFNPGKPPYDAPRSAAAPRSIE